MCNGFESFNEPDHNNKFGAIFLPADQVLELIAQSGGKLRIFEPLAEEANPFCIVGDADGKQEVIDSEPRDGGIRHISSLTLEEIAAHARLYENK